MISCSLPYEIRQVTDPANGYAQWEFVAHGVVMTWHPDAATCYEDLAAYAFRCCISARQDIALQGGASGGWEEK